jgi:hypothetical protein
MRDIHGIAFFDRKLWVVCSLDDMVAIYDFDKKSWRKWYPAAPNPSHRDCDIHHFNTIQFQQGQVWLLAHSFGPSRLFRFSYPDPQLISVTTLGVMAHDLFDMFGSVATCSCGEGRLVSSQGQTIKTGAFPRGYASINGNHFVGLSMKASRESRAEQDGMIRRLTATGSTLPITGFLLWEWS